MEKIKNVRKLTNILFMQIGIGLIFLVLEGDYCLIGRPEIDRIMLFEFVFNWRDSKASAGSRYFCESLFWASQPKQAAKT